MTDLLQEMINLNIQIDVGDNAKGLYQVRLITEEYHINRLVIIH